MNWFRNSLQCSRHLDEDVNVDVGSLLGCSERERERDLIVWQNEKCEEVKELEAMAKSGFHSSPVYRWDLQSGA